MAYEDFTTFTEVDEDGDITVSQNQITVDTMRRDANSYVYRDYGLDYFGDFTHDVDINWTGLSGTQPRMAVWALTNSSYTEMDADANNEGMVVGIRLTLAGSYLIYVKDLTNDNEDGHFYASLPGNRYLTITRSGATLTVEIYTDSGRTSLEDTLSITCGGTAYRNLFGVMSFEDTSYPSDSITATISNLNINITESTALEDISLDLSAYYQRQDDLASFLRAHDGLEYRDLKAALEAAGWTTDDLGSFLSAYFEELDDMKTVLDTWGTHYDDLDSFLAAYFQELGDMKTFLDTWATNYNDLTAALEAALTVYKDLESWLAAFGQELSSLAASLRAGKYGLSNLGSFLSATDGVVFHDLGCFLLASDGVARADVGLRLRAIAGIPTFRVITAQKVSAVIHEVI